ncbi:MAG: hypothetical protein IJS15_08785 [Victivallales bacterium]|nr:hypothetical protein [Victivallales bacterium]
MRVKNAFLAAALCACAAFAADFNFSFIGKYSDKYTKEPEKALFDGQLKYNGAHIIWEAGVAPKGCGLLLTFPKPTAVSKVVVVTSKPNPIAYTPERTEFQEWNSEKHDWNGATVVNDVTGRWNDKSFITGEPIKTEWQPNATTEGIRILMFGHAIWLTEIEVYDANGAKLTPEPIPAANPESKTLGLSAHGGGASVNITFYNEKQAYVGNPNPLGRKDRSMLMFDISGLLDKGAVKGATLELGMDPMGIITTNLFAIEVFENSRSSLRNQDLIASDAKLLRQFLFSSQSHRTMRVDVTELVNGTLAKGEGNIGFRLKDITVEKVGNRQNKAEGLILKYQSCKLEIAQ